MSTNENLKKTIVLASGNQGKLKEIAAILEPLGCTLRLQKEFFSEEAQETGLSFIENAIIKARFASEKTHLPALADDSGICVDVLNGAPGIYSARFSESGNDEDNNQKLLKALENYPNLKDRSARYICAIAYVRHAADPTPLVVTASWEGFVGFKEVGSGGFGYDPLFIVKGRDQTAAQLPVQVKNLLSHRAKALLEFEAKFVKYA